MRPESKRTSSGSISTLAAISFAAFALLHAYALIHLHTYTHTHTHKRLKAHVHLRVLPALARNYTLFFSYFSLFHFFYSFQITIVKKIFKKKKQQTRPHCTVLFHRTWNMYPDRAVNWMATPWSAWMAIAWATCRNCAPYALRGISSIAFQQTLWPDLEH